MKIVVPIMPTSIEEIEHLDMDRLQDADIIEWRADYLSSKEQIVALAPAVFEKLVGREVIFTLRTAKEGGRMDVTDGDYLALMKEIGNLYQPDYIDFEYYSHQAIFDEMLDFSNLILSYSNHQGTPENYLEIMSELTSLSPAVVRMAVTPQTEQDVLDVMNYTRGFKSLHSDQRYATYSMGQLGVLSRLSGNVTGSCWTFAYLDQPSEPGQLSLAQMKKILEVLE